MIVAIHQPNYAPWLGYFHKIARADAFVFLDDAQFSKNSYINRVQIDGGGAPRWLTVPVRVTFGDPINRVMPAEPEWRRRHLDTLRHYYRAAAHFRPMWAALEEIYASLPAGDLAASNRALILAIAERLGLRCRFVLASTISTGGALSDSRLVALVRAVAGEGRAVYLSGRGGAAYQDAAKFSEAGIALSYSDFVHPTYAQAGPGFLPGLSVIDALFHAGWDDTARMLREAAAA